MQRTEEERQDDATLLALRMKERATSQGTWAASRGENTREPFFFFWLLQVSVVTHRIFDLRYSMQNLFLWHVGSSSPSRDQTWAPCTGNAES